MKAKTLLRISFGLILFHLLGHSVGHFTWRDTAGPDMTRLIGEMDTRTFDFMGTLQTLGGQHDGYSILLGLTLTLLAAITWMSSSALGQVPTFKPLVIAIGVFLVAFGAVELIYFFPLPGVTSILAGAAQLAGATRKE